MPRLTPEARAAIRTILDWYKAGEISQHDCIRWTVAAALDLPCWTFPTSAH
jgi:hypothetical protein